MNYSSFNYTNKRNNKKYQSSSESKKNNNKVDFKYNNTFNKIIINKIEEINHKKKWKMIMNIERIIKIINNMKKEINKYNN